MTDPPGQQTLQAAAHTEQPFCDSENAKSIDVALLTIDFHFWYLDVLLTRYYNRERCVESSKRMLVLLQDMAPERKEPYHPISWQLAFCPFTPFLILFCHILTSEIHELQENEDALGAMEILPEYLDDLGSRMVLGNLRRIAKVFVRHAKSVISSRQAFANPTASETFPSGRASNVETVQSSSFHRDIVAMAPLTMRSDMDDLGAGLIDDLATFTDNLEDGGMIDWLNWYSTP